MNDHKTVFQLIKLMLKIPYKIGAQGKRWFDLYLDLGVPCEKIIVLRNWLPQAVNITEKPKSVHSGRMIHFIFIGWIVREKGIYELLEAISVLRLRYRFRLTLVGGGTLEAEVLKKIRDNLWIDDVKVIGWKNNNDVLRLLDSADIFVLPSHAEGFPNSLLEAMAKGLPAICCDTGGISDSLVDGINGFLVPVGEYLPLAEAMERYLLEPSLVNKHSKATLNIIRMNHDFESNCKALFNVFNE